MKAKLLSLGATAGLAMVLAAEPVAAAAPVPGPTTIVTPPLLQKVDWDDRDRGWQWRHRGDRDDWSWRRRWWWHHQHDRDDWHRYRDRDDGRWHRDGDDWR
jgi:hypothetical protein